MRRILIMFLAAAVVAAGAGLWFGLRDAPPRAGVAVLGDESPAILEAAGWSQAAPLDSAGFTAVSVGDWDRLRYIADMAALCGPACSGEAGLVRVLALSPGGSHKIVFVNLAAWPRTADDAPDIECLARTLAAERRQPGAPEAMPDCAAAVPAGRTRWALPFGLGLI